MSPTPEDFVCAAGDLNLEGLPACHPWSALFEIGDARVGLTVNGTRMKVAEDATINSSWDFSCTVSEQEWESFCAHPIGRGYTSAQALVATLGPGRIRGNRAVWARAAGVVDRMFDALRAQGQAHLPPQSRQAEPERRPGGFSPIEGGYLHVDVGGAQQRIYVESAGSGMPLLCLHTAGADSRQFRYLLEDPSLIERFRVVAFDMPWHGRSDPPDDWQSRRYALTTETYTETVLAVMSALNLDAPVLVGCSMGGSIALYLASQHGQKFAGICALEAGLGNPGRFVDWTNRSDVDHSTFLTSWVGGLIAPGSPSGPRAQTLWGYAQSGPGVYQGDTYFYSQDFPRHVDALTPATCPLYIFSGEYDYSATTEMSREAASRLGGEVIEMPGKGHFPMSEDPVSFAAYLFPVLELLHDKYQRSP